MDYVSGASIAIKREVIAKIGLLDPKFYAYGEDNDLCYRARKAGYTVVTSNAIVYHYGSVSWDRFPLKKLYLNNRNNLYFIMKHYTPQILLRYVFEYPIRSFKLDLWRFVRGETVLQRVEKPSENTKRERNSIVALKTFLLNIAMFYITLVSVVIWRPIKELEKQKSLKS